MLLVATMLLGGVSLLGPPLLLAERRHRRRSVGGGQGRLVVQGMASWLLWPPIIYTWAPGLRMTEAADVGLLRLRHALMALYVTLSLWPAAGCDGSPSAPTNPSSCAEQFGIVLGLAWAAPACTFWRCCIRNTPTEAGRSTLTELIRLSEAD